MTRNPKGEPVPDAEAVAKFLRRNPTFFADHRDLLEVMRIPHGGTGNAASLLERQVEVLRDRRIALEDQMQSLLDRAREHEALTAKVFEVATFLVGLGDRAQLEQELPGRLRELFRVTAVCLRGPGDEAAREAVAAGGDAPASALRARLGHGRTVCDDRLPAGLRAYLFGSDAERIRSVAMVPVGEPRGVGVLAFGDDDPQRFRPDMGTLYLDRLGALTAAALSRLAAESGA